MTELPGVVCATSRVIVNVDKSRLRFMVYRDRCCLCGVNAILYLLLKCVVRMAFTCWLNEQKPVNIMSSMLLIKTVWRMVVRLVRGAASPDLIFVHILF